MTFSQIKMYGIALLVLTLVGLSAYYKYTSMELEKDLVELDNKLQAEIVLNTGLGTELQEAKEQSDMHYQLYYEQVELSEQLRAELTTKINEINKYKGRESTVYAKPGLVEKLEQKALNKFFQEVQNGD